MHFQSNIKSITQHKTTPLLKHNFLKWTQ